MLESTGKAFAAGNVNHASRLSPSPPPDDGDGSEGSSVVVGSIPSDDDNTVVESEGGDGDASASADVASGKTGSLTKRSSGSPTYGADAAELRTLVHQFVRKYQVSRKTHPRIYAQSARLVCCRVYPQERTVQSATLSTHVCYNPHAHRTATAVRGAHWAGRRVGRDSIRE